MISVEEARKHILASLRPTATETISLAQGWGRVLAASVHARRNQPPDDVSSMDGYALRGPGPWTIIGSAPAGHPFDRRLGNGEAVRLFTGSLVPQGAETILIQENAVLDGADLTATDPPGRDRHIRPAGGDFHAGEILLEPGRRLGPRGIGLAAAADRAWLTVHRRPRIGILATGDEIALPGDPIRPGGVVSSNAHVLAAQTLAAGGEPVILPIAADTVEAIAAATDQVGRLDLLVTTGGASVGDHDLVQRGLGERGFTLDFWQIAMRPGKPLLFGRLRDTPVLGLPGNPVSTFVCGLLFLTPAIGRLAGLVDTALPTSRARLACPLAANDHRADHLRAVLRADTDDTWEATPFPQQDSSHMRRLYQAEALVLRPPHAPAATIGDYVQIILLDRVS